MYDMHNDVEMIWKGWKGKKEKKCMLDEFFLDAY